METAKSLGLSPKEVEWPGKDEGADYPYSVYVYSGHIPLRDSYITQFACKHCKEIVMAPDALDRLAALEEEWGDDLLIKSGYRCPFNNKKAGGAMKSSHLSGYAVDIGISGSVQRSRMVEIAMTLKDDEGKRLFPHLGIYARWVHLGWNPEAEAELLWTKENSRDVDDIYIAPDHLEDLGWQEKRIRAAWKTEKDLKREVRRAKVAAKKLTLPLSQTSPPSEPSLELSANE